MTVTPNLGRHLVPLAEGGATLLGAHRGRRWVDDSELGFFELIGSQFSDAVPHPMLAIYPQVVDAQQLIQQVISAAQRGHSVAFLDLVRARVVRPITTSRCVREADQKLPVRAREQHIELAVVERFWLPLRTRLRVVEVEPSVPYAAILDQRAPSDRDLAQLATLLGIQAQSWDLDLRDYGLAARFDLTVANAIGELASGKCAAFMGLGLTAETTAALVRLLRWCVAQAINHPLLAAAIALGLVVMVDQLRKSERLMRHLASVDWRPLLTEALEAAGQLMQSYHHLALQMPDAPRVVPTLPQMWNVSRLLANSPGPISAREISDRLAADDLFDSESHVREVLRAHPALFVRNRRGQWQLGDTPRPASATS